MPEPIKIGWLGSALDGPDGGYDKIHRLAFDEGVERGLLDRPVRVRAARRERSAERTAKNATDGFRYLVDEGCIGVAGAYSSDNAITVAPLANELQVPLISGPAPSVCRASTASGSATATAVATLRWSSRG